MDIKEILNNALSKRNSFVLEKAIQTRGKMNLLAEVENKVPTLVRDYIKGHTQSDSNITELIARELSKLPPKIITKVLEKETVIKEISKKDDKKYLEQKDLKDLREGLKALEGVIETLKQFAVFHGGGGVIGIPPPEGNNGKTLQVSNNKPSWATVSSGGSSSQVYTPTNVTPTRSYNAANTSLAELANVLGTLIIDLQGAGIVQ